MSHVQVDIQQWNNLAEQLRSDQLITTRLIEVLKQERQALEKRDYQAITEQLALKQTMLVELEQNAISRQNWLKQFTIESESELKQSAPVGVVELWSTLSESWQQCQTLNETNAVIAKRSQQVASRLLDILKGDRDTTYTAEGIGQSRGAGQTITSA